MAETIRCNKCGEEKTEDGFYKWPTGKIRKPCIECFKKLDANSKAKKKGKEPPYTFTYKKESNVAWSVLFHTKQEEKENISKVYKDSGVTNKAGRILGLIRNDVKQLEDSE